MSSRAAMGERVLERAEHSILLELGPDSDVAVRDSDSGALRCVGCSLRFDGGDFVAEGRREMLRHLLRHEEEGEQVPRSALDELSST
jgi:hypothetical protein